MGAYNFQAQFADAVEVGCWFENAERTENVMPIPYPYRVMMSAGLRGKRQTIRAHRKDGWRPKPGDKLKLYTGMRTKKCRLLGEVVCKRVREISIGYMGVGMDVDLTAIFTGFYGANCGHAIDEFARADGFKDYKQMRGFFYDSHPFPFKGLLIEW